MAYTTINKGTDHFRIKLYAGNSTASRGITFDESSNMKPDWVWIKERDAAINHYGFDSVRGATKGLSQNITNAESTRDSTWFNSFDTNGFTIGAEDNINDTGDNYVSWCWKASNATAVSNTDGSITSSVSANTTAGFSIVSYVGTGANATVGHGLSATPKFIIIKSRDSAYGWRSYHASLGATKYIVLNDTSAATTASNYMNDTEPTSSVFSLGNGQTPNDSGDNYIAYCFAEKKGYSKFGSYTGNGNADGTFVYTGFKPAFVIIKRTDSTNNWLIFDNKRNEDNPMDKLLYVDLSSTEATQENYDFLSNGFKCKGTGGKSNTSGGTYIFMAFAEAPIVGTNNVPANAR